MEGQVRQPLFLPLSLLLSSLLPSLSYSLLSAGKFSFCCCCCKYREHGNHHSRVIMGRLQRRRKPEKDLDRPQDKRKADSEVSSAIGSVKTKPRSQVRKMAYVIEGRIGKIRDYELACRVCSTCSLQRSRSTLMRMARHQLKSNHLINPFHIIRSNFSLLLCI